MTTLREAAQQVLEALEALDAPPSGVVDHYELERRKQALRAVLAQEKKDIAQNLLSRLGAAMLLEERRQEIAQPRRETEQEPVAWQWLNSAYFRKKPPANAESGAWIPLYTAPPRREWQSLTEEEIDDLSRTMVKGHKSVNWLTRAIEAALKEKNQ